MEESKEREVIVQQIAYKNGTFPLYIIGNPNDLFIDAMRYLGRLPMDFCKEKPKIWEAQKESDQLAQ